MNEGVKLLIDRMESNPEDFAERDFDDNGKMSRGKFRSIADLLRKRLSGESAAWDAMNVLTTEEIEALTAAYLQMERKRFTNSIMAKLLAEKLEDEEGPMTAGFIAQPLVFNSNLGIGTTSGSNGTSVNKAAFTITTTGTPTMQLGAQKLTEKDVKTMSEMIAKWRGEDDGVI